MLTFNVILRYQGLLFQDVLRGFVGFFFQSDRPTEYQETQSTLNGKKRMALSSHSFSQAWKKRKHRKDYNLFIAF